VINEKSHIRERKSHVKLFANVDAISRRIIMEIDFKCMWTRTKKWNSSCKLLTERFLWK